MVTETFSVTSTIDTVVTTNRSDVNIGSSGFEIGTDTGAVISETHTHTFTDSAGNPTTVTNLDAFFEGFSQGDVNQERNLFVEVNYGSGFQALDWLDPTQWDRGWEREVNLTSPGVVRDTNDSNLLSGRIQGTIVGDVESVRVTMNPVGTFNQHIRGVWYDFLSAVICFGQDTLIETDRGPVRAADLRIGDKCRTADHGWQAIRWLGRKRITAGMLAHNPKLRPVKIAKGALGRGLPHRDLWVSRQHRMLIASPIAKRMFGTAQVLIPAVKLLGIEGVQVDTEITEIDYIHVLLDRHEVVFAEGAPSESLLVGPEAEKMLSKDELEEIRTILPEAMHQGDAQPARVIPKRSKQNNLMQRHSVNKKPALSGTF